MLEHEPYTCGRVIVFHIEPLNLVFDASSEDKLYRACLHVMTQRLLSGQWYSLETSINARVILEGVEFKERGAGAYAFMLDRSEADPVNEKMTILDVDVPNEEL